VLLRDRALETLEDVWHALDRDADAAIAHPEARLARLGLELHVDRSTATELQGVRHEVVDHLLEAHAVPSPDERRRHIHGDGAPRVVELFAQALDDLDHDVGEVDVLERERQLSGVQARDVEQLVHESSQAFDLTLRDRERARERGQLSGFDTLGKRLNAELQRRDRSAQLVRGDRQELVAQPHSLLHLLVELRVVDREGGAARELGRELDVPRPKAPAQRADRERPEDSGPPGDRHRDQAAESDLAQLVGCSPVDAVRMEIDLAEVCE
jgi:hypothetical protein